MIPIAKPAITPVDNEDGFQSLGNVAEIAEDFGVLLLVAAAIVEVTLVMAIVLMAKVRGIGVEVTIEGEKVVTNLAFKPLSLLQTVVASDPGLDMHKEGKAADVGIDDTIWKFLLDYKHMKCGYEGRQMQIWQC